MKYEVLFEKGRYALILRGEKMCEYAVVKDLEQRKQQNCRNGGNDYECMVI
uniref:hypothetical protein n=1 Tax=Coprococcus catus TaxID=116085 RepID=UPI0022E96600|nr:hypothetical protein [Coprococcus catus]